MFSASNLTEYGVALHPLIRYRANRTLCGSLEYRQLERVWCVAEHAEFPLPVRAAVFTMLCANKRPDCVLSLLPVELLLTLLEVGRLTWDGFPSLPARKRKKKNADRTAKRARRQASAPGAEAAASASGLAREEEDWTYQSIRFSDEEQELDEPKESRRRKNSSRTKAADSSSPAVSPTQDPASTTGARAQTRRVRQRRSKVRVVES